MTMLPPMFYPRCHSVENPWVPVKQRIAYADISRVKGEPPGLILYASQGVELLRIMACSPSSTLQLLAPEDILGRGFYLDGVAAQDDTVYRLYIPTAVSGVGFSTLYMHNTDGLILS